MTNLNKTKEEIIYELTLSLNKGNYGDAKHNIDAAVFQYNQMLDTGIIKEIKESCNHNWHFERTMYFPEDMSYQKVYTCTECGAIRGEDCTTRRV